MMKIKRWDNNEVIFELKCDSWVDLIKGAIKAKVSFYKADLSSANLSYVDLSSANLSSANLSSANLSYADLSSADLSYVDLSYVDLSSANLSSANLSYADLSYANLSYADLSSANLSSADLSYVDLSYVDLSYVDLSYAIGNMTEIKSMQIDTYFISFNKTKLNIGCESHAFKEWEDFSDKRIDKMDSNSLEWWNKWKEFIFMAIELSNIKEEL